jgi:D-3-phosphoglycerate dehydrogenase
MPKTIFITDYSFANLEPERAALAGSVIRNAQCKTAADVIAQAGDADVLMVQWAPITAEVLDALPRVRLVVRYGIGVDNVDLAAASARGVVVCNVPDYSIDEVADHTVALALSLGRQLSAIDARTRGCVWKLAPVSPMPAFREMTFAVAGFGRIGRSVLERARPFKFRLAAYDPVVPAAEFERLGVQRLELDTLFREADVLSLHSPLLPQTKHLVNAHRLATMKPAAVVVNTARGGLVDTVALATALKDRRIGFAGLDVFEDEPLPADHPLRQCDNALLTSHVAWYSERSLEQLQRLAAEEAARFVRGEPVMNRVNQ